MTAYAVVPVTRSHMEELAQTLRHWEITELAEAGHEPLPAIIASVECSMTAFAGLADGKVLCIFGHCTKTFTSDEAFPWMITAEDVPKHTKAFLRLNKAYIADLRQRYRLLWGAVRETNAASIRWLTWLGFVIDAQPTHHAPGQPGVYYFRLET